MYETKSLPVAQAFYKFRSELIDKLRQTKTPNPYPHKFNVTQSIPRYIRQYGAEGKIENGITLEKEKPVSQPGPLQSVPLT